MMVATMLVVVSSGRVFAGGLEAAALAAKGRALSAASLPPGTPPSPPGYSNTFMVMAAIATKQLKLISRQVEIPSDVVATKGIEYGRAGDHPLRLDLYQPRHLQRAVPGLIFIHGGGWRSGSRASYEVYTVRYARRGYVTATISYRLCGTAPFPAAVQDAKCAVRWMRANAAKYHVNPNEIGVVGGSAGGHLALMIGYSPGVAALEGTGGYPEVSDAVQAVVDFYGPYDLTTDFARRNATVLAFLGGKTYADAPQLYLQASPAHYLKAGAPPTLIFHGTIDDTVPIRQADMLAVRLKELGVPFWYDRLEGWPHTLDLAASVNRHCEWVMNRFLARYLPLPPKEHR